jgi:hypothetical protein
MADIMMKVAFSANVTGLATAVAGLRNGFESPSAVDVHRNARGKCTVVNGVLLPSWMLYQDVQLLWDSGLVRGESGYSL